MGVFWLIALAIVTGANFWLAGAWLGSVRSTGEPVFAFAARPLWQLPAWWALLALPAFFAARRRILQPALARQLVLLLSMPLAALALAASPFRGHAAPFIYVFLDLHPWVLAGSVLLLASGANGPLAALRAKLGRLAEKESVTFSSGWLDAVLVMVLVASSLATSPVLRFQSSLNGDEPKYVRYLENWYQGHGMEVGGIEPVARLQPGRPAVLDNLGHLGAATRLLVSDLWQEARRLARLPHHLPDGQARGVGNWFVEGKRGGIYQVHSPGFSFLLFPGYLIDRTFLNWSSDFHPQFPSNLYCTATLILLLYAAWGLALFRLLVAYTRRPGLSWAVSCGVFLALPAAAFAYQYYPEVAGGFAITLLARFAWFPDRQRKTGAIVAHGLLAGFLPWLHLRFGAVAMVVLATFAFRQRRSKRRLAAFLAGFLVPAGALGAYYYHVSGSFAPWALYALSIDEGPAFDAWHGLASAANYWLDPGGGLPAHAPLFVLSLPGLYLAWQRSRAVAAAAALTVLTLAFTAASHGWAGGGTAPLRLVASVVPLLALPLTDTIERYGRSRWFQALLAVLAVVSIQNGLTYSSHLFKDQPWLLGPTIGGWLTPLLFAERTGAGPVAQPRFWWGVATLVLIALPALPALRRSRNSAPEGQAPVRAASLPVAVTTAALALALFGWLLGGWTGHRTRTAFMYEREDAREHVVAFRTANGDGILWTSSLGQVALSSLFPNSNAVLAFEVEPPDVLPFETVNARVTQASGESAWGTITIDFGDRTPPLRQQFIGSLAARHSFAAPGTYGVELHVVLPGAKEVHEQRTVRVGSREAPSLTARALEALPGGLLERPVVVDITEVRFSTRDLTIVGSVGDDCPADVSWVWLIAQEGGRERARVYGGQPRGKAEPPGRVNLTVTPAFMPEDDGEVIGIVVGVGGGGRPGVAGRSEVISLRVPGPLLRIGGDIIEDLGGPEGPSYEDGASAGARRIGRRRQQ